VSFGCKFSQLHYYQILLKIGQQLTKQKGDLFLRQSVKATALVACLSAHQLQTGDSGVPGITRTSTWLPHWWLPACGWLWSTDKTITWALFLYCTTLQQHIQQTIILCGWPTFVEWLAQRSLQHQTFSWHFWQTSQNAIVLCFIRLQCIC